MTAATYLLRNLRFSFTQTYGAQTPAAAATAAERSRVAEFPAVRNLSDTGIGENPWNGKGGPLVRWSLGDETTAETKSTLQLKPGMNIWIGTRRRRTNLRAL